MKKGKVMYQFILDESGSMQSCMDPIIKGFNQQLETIQQIQHEDPTQNNRISLLLFNHLIREVLSDAEVDACIPLSTTNYSPSGTTALLDAIGTAVDRLSEADKDETTNFVVIILTDGYENASIRYNYHMIAEKIKSLEATGRWTFTFLGADMDAIHTSKMLNIKSENTIKFSKSYTSGMMDDISDAIKEYSKESKAQKEFLIKFRSGK
ncbi:MAG: vWA domain-containing protein [Crocinitomicaceae bacterium]